MADFTLQPQHTGIMGMTGSGKTTFVNRYLLNDSPACRFIFDDLNRMAPRLKLAPSYSQPQLEKSLETRWSVFNPLRMFPGDTRTALRWWLKWVFHCATRGPGKKMVVIPEVWRHCNQDTIPPELALLAQAGRELHVELILDTQRPELLNGSLVGALTELVAFRLQGTEALRAFERMSQDSGLVVSRQEIASLPLGSFIGFNRLSGARLGGRVF